MTRCYALAALLLGLASTSRAQAPPPPPARSDQEVRRDRIVDHGWGFELVRPEGARWMVLGEAAARGMQPEFVGGFLDMSSGVALAIMVETRAGVTALDAARDHADDTQLGEKRIVRIEAATVAGHEGAIYELFGKTADGTSYHHAAAVIVDRGRVYTLLSYGTPDQTVPGSAFMRWDVLRLDPGPVPGREAVALGPPDTYGVGWRVRSKVVESVALGARIDPAHTGLRLVVGADARGVWSEAGAALQDPHSDLWLALLPASPRSCGPAELEAHLRVDFLDDHDAKPVESRTMKLADGDALVLRRWVERDGALDSVLGVVERDGKACFAVIGGWGGATRADSFAKVERALAGVTPLDDSTRRAIGKELAALPDPEGFVGPAASYRRGVVKSYARDLTWTRPRTGGPWTVLMDLPALATYGEGSEAVLKVIAPEVGVTAWLAVQDDAAGTSAAAFHQWARDHFRGESERPARELELGGLTWLVTDLDTPGPDVRRQTAATTVVGDRHIIFVIGGSAKDLDALPDLTRTLCGGVAVSDQDLVALARTPEAWRVERFGYLLRRPAPGWTFSTHEDDPQAADVSAVKVEDASGHRLEVLAVAGQTDVTDPVFYEDYLVENALGNMREELDLTPNQAEKETLCGLPCRRIVAKGPDGIATIFVTYQAGIHYVFGIFSRDGAGPSVVELRRCFELID